MVVVVQAALPVLLCSLTVRGCAGGSEPVSTTVSCTMGWAGAAVSEPASGAAATGGATSASPLATSTAAIRRRAVAPRFRWLRRPMAHSLVRTAGVGRLAGP